MKKILILTFSLISLIGYSQVCTDSWNPISTCDDPTITNYTIEIRAENGGVLETLDETSTSSTVQGVTVVPNAPILDVDVSIQDLTETIVVCLVSLTDACTASEVELCETHEPPTQPTTASLTAMLIDTAAGTWLIEPVLTKADGTPLPAGEEICYDFTEPNYSAQICGAWDTDPATWTDPSGVKAFISNYDPAAGSFEFNTIDHDNANGDTNEEMTITPSVSGNGACAASDDNVPDQLHPIWATANDNQTWEAYLTSGDPADPTSVLIFGPNTVPAEGGEILGSIRQAPASAVNLRPAATDYFTIEHNNSGSQETYLETLSINGVPSSAGGVPIINTPGNGGALFWDYPLGINPVLLPLLPNFISYELGQAGVLGNARSFFYQVFQGCNERLDELRFTHESDGRQTEIILSFELLQSLSGTAVKFFKPILSFMK